MMISCSYSNCSNDKINQADIGFFKFPVYDLELLQTWLTKCGNSDLYSCSLDELNTKYICEKHFAPEVVLLKTKEDGRVVKVLKKYFAPTQFKDEEKLEPLEVTVKDDSNDEVQIMIQNDDEGNTIVIIDDVDDIDEDVDIKDVNTDCKIDIKKEILELEEPMIQDELINDDNKDGVIDKGDTLNTLCYVQNCTVKPGKSVEDIFYFNPPSNDENMFKIWDICIGHEERRLSKKDRICREHFSKENLVTKIKIIRNEQGFTPVEEVSLKTDAVPCITFKKECCVPDCRNVDGRMYCFPVVRDSSFHLWLYLIKNPMLRNLKLKDILQYRICENHFEHDCFDKDFKLKHSAAPTICVPEHYPTLPVSEMSPATPKEYSQLLVGKCIYKGCKNARNQQYLFRFPLEPDRCVKWLHACGRSEIITTPKETVQIMSSRRLGVCQDHFDINDFTMNISKVKPTAVPKFYSKHIKAEPKDNPTEGESSKFPSNSRQILNYKIVKAAGSQGDTLYKLSESQLSSTGAFTKMNEGVCIYRTCKEQVTLDTSVAFPKEMKRDELWLQACGLGNLNISKKIDIVSNARVCSKHFKRLIGYVERNLRLNDVPKAHVYDDKTVAETNMSSVESNLTKPNELQNATYRSYQPKHVTTVHPQNTSTVQPKTVTTDLSQNAINDQPQPVIESENNPTSEIEIDVTNQPVEDLKETYSEKTRTCAAHMCFTPLYSPEIYHSFPNPVTDKERFSLWMQLLLCSGSKDIPHQTIFENYGVCNKHFQKKMFKKGTTELLPVAVPMDYPLSRNTWFYETDYYKNKIKTLRNSSSEKQDDFENAQPSPETDSNKCLTLVNGKRCVLEEDRINFPDLGTHLYTGHEGRQTQGTSQRGTKRPYGVYRYLNKRYGLDGDVQFGENFMIHTAIIIDDDDTCERRAIQQLLKDNL